MPSTPTVSVWPQSIRVGPSPAPSAIADDVDAAWRDLVHADVEPCAAHPLRR